ncbi:SYF2 splicing factor-domain-containing protein [Rhodotorula toruloides]
MEERMAKMKELRKRMNDSARANRQDVVAEMNAQRASARTLARLERKRQQAEAMGEKQRAVETGEDLERKKNWEYSIEDNEKWDKKQAKKARRADFSFTDYDDIARRKYKKDLDDFKPDLAAYNKQREAVTQTDALVASASGGEVGPVLDNTGLYRDANSFVYADHKPTDEQIDRVIGKLNSDIDKRQKRSRKRENEEQGDITWINEKNRMFNRKLARYYDDVTRETRENFERGTAL